MHGRHVTRIDFGGRVSDSLESLKIDFELHCRAHWLQAFRPIGRHDWLHAWHLDSRWNSAKIVNGRSFQKICNT